MSEEKNTSSDELEIVNDLEVDMSETPEVDELSTSGSSDTTENTTGTGDESNSDEQKQEALTDDKDIDGLLDKMSPQEENKISNQKRAEDRANTANATVQSQVNATIALLNSDSDLTLEQALDRIPKSLQWTRADVRKELSQSQPQAQQFSAEEVARIVRETYQQEVRQSQAQSNIANFKDEFKESARLIPSEHFAAFAEEAKVLQQAYPQMSGHDLVHLAASRLNIVLGEKIIREHQIKDKRSKASLPPRSNVSKAGKVTMSDIERRINAGEKVSDKEFDAYFTYLDRKGK